MQLADQQERHAQLESRVMQADRQLQAAREQQRGLERQAQEAQFARRKRAAPNWPAPSTPPPRKPPACKAKRPAPKKNWPA